MELSVIIPCLNAQATIATQLEALAGQHWTQPWEVLVADNGSTDRSVEIAGGFRDRLSNLQVIDASARRGTSYYARNVGARVAAGKSLAFCDADDCVEPGWVAGMGEALSRHDVVYGQNRFDRFNDPKKAEISSRRWKDGLYREQFLPHAATCNLGVKRSVHEQIGGFDECLPRFADGDYCWRLQLEGYSLHYVPEAIVQYRIGRTNTSLPYQFRRAMTAAACDYWLYKKYRSMGVTKDMILSPDYSFKRSFISWLRSLKNMPYSVLLSRETRAVWLRNFISRTGDVIGHFQGRLMNPCRPYVSAGKTFRIDFPVN
ncbi:MAG: glycosyltransferase [Candidatus Sulfobium sp.]